MADAPKDDANDQSDTWVWVPNTSYGPFTFGSPRHETPAVGPVLDESEMGPVDRMAFYESTIGDVDLAFWNDRLTSVEARDTFAIGETELIGADYNDVKHIVKENPGVSNDTIFLTAEFDSLNMTWFMTLDWEITSVVVAVDPDVLPTSLKDDRGQNAS